MTNVGSWLKTAGKGGFDLFLLKLTNRQIKGDKPILFATAALHGQELATSELLLRFAEKLVAEYNVDADSTWLLDHQEVHLLLIANPDGREKSQPGYWVRKNVDLRFCSNKPKPASNNPGVDLNRNFSYKWGCCGGSSTTPCVDTFRGEKADAEPETGAIERYITGHFEKRERSRWKKKVIDDLPGLYLDIHSSGQLVLWPWGYNSSPAPNEQQFQTIGRKLAYFNKYTPQQSAQYTVNDGTATEFGYGEIGLVSLLIEVGTHQQESCEYFH